MGKGGGNFKRNLFDKLTSFPEIWNMTIGKYIEVNSSKRFGKAILIVTRISVSDVLNWLANGMSKKEIINDFPELSVEQIQACLQFAANREQGLGIAL